MRIGRKRGECAALFAAALSLFFGSTELAFAKTCRQLEAELASTGSSGGSAQLRKYDQAVNAQREQISIARRRARSAGCGFSFLGGRSACGDIDARIDRMERNLAALQRKRTQLAGSGGLRRDRSRILAALDASGCRGERLAERPRRPPTERDGQGAALFDRIFGSNAKARALQEEDGARGLRSATLDEHADRSIRRTLDQGGRIIIGGSGGEFRTLCVRTCDGYFFPMSSASSRIDFDRDQKNCESVCPGAEVQLYHHRAADEESDDMVSAVTGDLYTALPTAYLYKATGTTRPEGCGCNPAKNFSIIAGNPPNERSGPVTVRRSAPPSAPETPANAEVGPTLTPATVPHEAGQRKVRVVGPVFLPDPEGAIDLRAPAPKTAR